MLLDAARCCLVLLYAALCCCVLLGAAMYDMSVVSVCKHVRERVRECGCESMCERVQACVSVCM